MKYKVGDKVCIKSKKWWDEQPKNACGSVPCGAYTFTSNMSLRCGRVAEICDIPGDFYYIKDDDFRWTDEMFEGLVNEEKPMINEYVIKDIAEVIKKHNLGVSVSEKDGKIIIEPLKVEEDLPIDTPCMVSDDAELWSLRFYSGFNSCYCDGKKSSNYNGQSSCSIIVPFDKFDPNNIEESLKHNIVK